MAAAMIPGCWEQVQLERPASMATGTELCSPLPLAMLLTDVSGATGFQVPHGDHGDGVWTVFPAASPDCQFRGLKN